MYETIMKLLQKNNEYVKDLARIQHHMCRCMFQHCNDK